MNWTKRLGAAVAMMAMLFAGCGGSDGGNNNKNGNGGNGNGGNGDFKWVWGAQKCAQYDAAASVSVGNGNSSFAGGSDGSGNVTISPGDWVYFTWSNVSDGVKHNVKGDKWNNDPKCGTDDLAWFQSQDRSQGTGCLQINKTGTFWYQCTIGMHCENGMSAKITVEE